MLGSLSGFRSRLLDWYDAEKRDLPWRVDTDPYRVWVSEIMLQQTTVATVVPYYERWVQRFPTASALAESDIDEALALWQGLGYYRRCRNLHAAANIVSIEGLPDDLEGWMALPGVGRYTAGAICAIALNMPVAAVDGNVERVFARVHSDDDVDLMRSATEWSTGLVQCHRPGDVVQALMELGATVCRPATPSCERCPVSASCLALKHGTQDNLPTPKKRKETVQLEHFVIVPVCEGRFGVRKIAEGQWWEGLYEFPRSVSLSRLLEQYEDVSVHSLGEVKHTVTHHRISIQAHIAVVVRTEEPLQWLSPNELLEIAMPAPQRRIADLATAYIGENSDGVASVPSSARK